ncbi:hypothetical protein N7462_007050 [Penicillium macrosclerotiorum]|uniref:uncharacterized protein n=1 Tax=Penicillium macrosclerotiorum TaxID=303699 RepID=UPI00254901F3|nr:uncharacterized protein N7462_007050 [Penicillium macrosclerotiorum]KAJ5678806.1 hypothetical protein N7462_007050 [Penicillium macrosclerotiorum]
MEYVTRGVCGQEGCRERRYYLDNGLWFCRRGHLQEGRQIEEDPDDFGTQGKKYRVRKEKEERARKTYRGRQAFTLLLQAFQLIIWKQSHALVTNHGFPEQFEAVVRDLWALRLQDFELKINASTEDDGEEGERELFSSQAEANSSDGLGFKTQGKYFELPRIVESVGLCYLASILMRLPVCIHDFYRLIMRQEIPYIRVSRAIPRNMRDKLPPEYLVGLDVNKFPKPEYLHRTFVEIALHYNRQYGVSLPPLNYHPILFRHIKRLAIPIDVYETVKTLHDITGFRYHFPINRQRTDRWLTTLLLPDVQIIALVVVATKLLFPFDDLERHPATAKEPATQSIDWPLWVRAQIHFKNHEQVGGKIGLDKVIRLVDRDVLDMTPNQLDEYMDWYQNSWLDTPRIANPTADLFPVGRAGTTSQPQPTAVPSAASAQPVTTDAEAALDILIRTVMQDLKPTTIDPSLEEENRRPGSWYRRYRWESQLPETARAFYELAAELATISLPTLIKAVNLTEWKIAKVLEDRRRAEYFDREMAMQDDSMDELNELDEQLSELDFQD